MCIRDRSFIELNFPYQKIDSIHLDMQQQADSDLYTNGIRATIYVSDEGNQDYYQLPDQILLHDSLSSQYINLHLYGDSFRIKVVINEIAGKNVIIHDLSLNPQRPMSISWGRVVILSLIHISSVSVRRLERRLYGTRWDWITRSRRKMCIRDRSYIRCLKCTWIISIRGIYFY